MYEHIWWMWHWKFNKRAMHGMVAAGICFRTWLNFLLTGIVLSSLHPVILNCSSRVQVNNLVKRKLIVCSFEFNAHVYNFPFGIPWHSITKLGLE
jgi:hypothetical protein